MNNKPNNVFPMADDTTTTTDSNPQVLKPMPQTGTPALIAIPPQIAQTLVWVALGFAVGVWWMGRSKSSRIH